MEQHIKSLVPRLSKAVVAVEVDYASGSGVVISQDGLVLTAGHVSGRPNREVTFTFPDGRKARGKTLGAESDSDTGLMRITSAGPWPHVPVGELEHASVGDWVLALGHPGGFDLGRSLVVRLGRIIRLAPGVLQTDCTISPGDSGGPLFDMHGRVIGIHTSISSSLAENFHVPITEYAETWDQLVKSEDKLPRMFVGAEAKDEAAGCRVSEVEKNSPASKAGLKVGDLILKVEGREIKASASFLRWVGETKPGEVLDLEIKRGARVFTLPLKPESAPPRH
jgi:serine protease Do